MKKRVISIVLVLCTLLSCVPMQVWAVAGESAQRTENPFTDVGEDSWYYEAVLYGVEQGLFQGLSPTLFSPTTPMTRGMYVTVLGRMAKVELSQYQNKRVFSDVSPSAYYGPYVAWAVEQGIAKGMGGGKFEPNRLVNREQMAVFTDRFFTVSGLEYPAEQEIASPGDLDQVLPYAKASVVKCWDTGLLKGDEKGNVSPRKNASRAEAAVLCMRQNKWVAQGISPNDPSPSPAPSVSPSSSPDPSLTPSPGVDPSASPAPVRYTLHYETNGGNPLESTKYKPGAPLGELPVPCKQGYVFEGWFYTEDFQGDPAQPGDTLRASATLYAKYTAPDIAEVETPQFAAELDVAPDFTITVVNTGTEAFTAEQVKEKITAKNLNSVEQPDFIQVTQSEEKVFLLAPAGGAFEEGATYKITLEEEALVFQGHPASAREFNFTTAKEEVLNLSLNEDLVYLPVSQVTQMTQNEQPAETLSVPLLTVSDTNGLENADMANGTFVYTGTPSLAVGQTVVIYQGTKPSERTLESGDGDVAYVKITQVSGSTYTYQGADVEEVLFTPDVLPVPLGADQDGDSGNDQIKVEKSVMDFSPDQFTQIDLDSQTTVDVGDYIAFYEGDFLSLNGEAELSYGKITQVILQDDFYSISYEPTTKEEMAQAMDVYDTSPVSGQELLENVDVPSLERSVEEQARESGFAEEAAEYLKNAVLETNAFTTLSDEMRLYGLTMENEDGTALDAETRNDLRGAKAKVSITKMNADLSKELQHFPGVSGLRLLLEVGIQITVDVNDSAQIIINVTGVFEQEVKIDINVSGGAVWDWTYVIPYIQEYEATTNLDLYDYTGISVNATMVTKEKVDGIFQENPTFTNIGQELKRLVEGTDGAGQSAAAKSMNEKYKAMLQNESEWVNLFDKDLCRSEGGIDPFHVLAYEIGISFVVAANLNLSLGCDFYYINAKRYSYTVQVFAKNVVNEVVNLQEEKYEFTFYIMGAMGLRAGVKAEVKVGLFTTTLASVGFSAEAGAYFKVWGYFYYTISYAETKGKESHYAGALLFELGIYLEVKFEAQAFAGTFSYNPTLYAHEWPLWTAGVQKNVQNFAYLPAESPSFDMKRAFTNAMIPDSVFNMSYLDLKEGDDKTGQYSDKEDFTIKMTNSAFTYNPDTNVLSVVPGGKPQQDGEMIVTWKKVPLAFTSAPIQRVVKLHWDELNDGYYIAFVSNGGSNVDMIVKKYEATITRPANPTRQGYVFAGWYSDDALTMPYTIPEKMPNRDAVVYAKWTPATDTAYQVEHYQQNAKNNQYELVKVEDKKGTTLSTVMPARENYPGFELPTERSLTIPADGSGVVRYYYPRAKYTLTFSYGVAAPDQKVEKEYRFGADISAPVISTKGYDFVAWDQTVAQTMPGENVTYTAQWTKQANTPYRVEYYWQNTAGEGYTLHEFENKLGETGASVQPVEKTYEHFKYEKTTANGEVTTATTIRGDGKLVMKLYYTRNAHQFTYQFNEPVDNPEAFPASSQRFDWKVEKPSETPGLEGYLFDGWYLDEAGTQQADFKTLKMPDADLVLYGKLSVDPDPDAGFSIIYNNIPEDMALDPEAYPKKYRQEEEDITLEPLGERKGYTFTGWFTDSACTAEATAPQIPTGSTKRKTFYAGWKADEYAITYPGAEGATHANPLSYTIESEDIKLSGATKTGYTFGGWFTEEAYLNEVTADAVAIAQGSTEAKEFYGKFTPNPYTVSFSANVVGGEQVTGSMQAQSFIYDQAQPLTTNTFARPGYTFTGWNTKPAGGGTSYSDHANAKNIATGDGVTLYAQWQAISYQITYDLQGGTNVLSNPTSYTIASSTIQLQPPTYTGHEFLGWKQIGEGDTESTIADIPNGSMGNLNLRATWKTLTYTVQFVPYTPTGGELVNPTTTTQEFTYGIAQNLKATGYQCKGFDFAGWSTSAGGTKQYDDQQSVSNLTTAGGTITLYPVWTEKTYTVKFNAPVGVTNVDGDWTQTISCKFTAKFTLPDIGGFVEKWSPPNGSSGGFISSGTSVSPKDLGANTGPSVTLVASEWKSGGGSQADPYLIFDRAGLEKIKNNMGGYYKLSADIDLADRNWTPISGTFTGTLTGGDVNKRHVIKNLKMVATNAKSQVGFFDTLGANAKIEYIIFDSVDISAAADCTNPQLGTVAGQVAGNPVLLITLEVKGKINAGSRGSAGGLVSTLQSGWFEAQSCIVSASLAAQKKGYIAGVCVSGATLSNKWTTYPSDSTMPEVGEG